MRYPAADVDAARILKALAHPARLALLRTLSEGCCCCRDLVSRLPLAQSTVSEHLRILKACGLVEDTGAGLRSAYRLDAESVGTAAAVLQDLALRLAAAEALRLAPAGAGCALGDRPAGDAATGAAAAHQTPEAGL